MTDRLELLQVGLFHQQICVAKGLTDTDLEAELGRQVATGLSGAANDWRVNRTTGRVQCDDHPEREHVILACGGFADAADSPLEKQFPDGDSESFR